MKLYDAECPVCGNLNKHLYLEETEGWMECGYCGSITRVTDPSKKIQEDPIFAESKGSRRTGVGTWV
ncbi:MAG: hypothetical protein IKG00_03760 [Lachnospiraceae bacterium]|nr:hypothetical protein [Lachnospiraceae bacterium]